MVAYHRRVTDVAPDILSEAVRAFLGPARPVTIATIGEDGRPNQAVIWYRLEPDGRILVNSRRERRWPRDLARDPRCSLAVVDERDSYRWVGLEAIVDEVVEDVATAREDIVALAYRYDGENVDPDDLAAYRRQERLTFRLRVLRVHDHLDV